MSMELVSVIMPTYNSSKYLADSIESVLAQTYSNLELIITDDKSTDSNVRKILEEYKAKDGRVKVHYFSENQGPGCARNNCIENARGRYIAFCDSDDRWMPNKLERQVALMNEKNCSLCYSSYLTCNEAGKENGIVLAPAKLTLNALKHDNKIGCLTAIYDTKPHGKFFMPTIRKRQDWALFLEIMKHCKVAYGVVEPLAWYRKTPNSVSSNKLGLIKYNAKVYEHVFGYNSLQAYAYFGFFFLPSYTIKVMKNRIASHFVVRD